MNWTANNGFIRRTYSRCHFQITLANEFIRECASDRLSRRGIPTDARAEIEFYKQEARFLRALQYWTLMDLFGSVPFTTDADDVGANLPRQASRAELYNYIESELLDLQTKLKPARSNEYGRADAAAAQALLARLYLNAETYLGAGNGKYDKAAEYAAKVIASGYAVRNTDYQQMMGANNGQSSSRNEFIFTINYDGLNTKGFGGTHFFAHASIGGSMNSRMFGINTGWSGLRTTERLPNLFPEIGNNGDNGVDRRAMFFTFNQKLEINLITTFGDGYAVTKYRNVKLEPAGTSDSLWFKTDSVLVRLPGHTYIKNDFVKIENALPKELNGTYQVGHVSGSVFKCKILKALPAAGTATNQATVWYLRRGNDPDQAFIDIDFPLFRLGEMYLIYAEAAARGAADVNLAVSYINELRERAYGNTSGNISSADLTTDFVLDERGRELYWEGHRRTDLIRYNRFVEASYLWPWKGGISTGAPVADFRKLFPIPTADITANPKLIQNPGY
jgi:hypothetical protein